MAGAFDDAWTLAQLRLGMGGNVEALDALWEISSSAAAAPFLVAHGLVVVGLNVLLAPEAGDRRRELVLGTLANAASHRCDGRLTLEIDGDVEVSAALRVEVSRLWVASSSVAVLTQCSRLVATALLTPKRQPSHPWLAPWASVASADAAAAIPNKPCAEKLLWLIAHAHDVELLAQCFALVRGVLWAAADGCALLGELLELLVSDEVGRGAIGWAALERDGGSLASALGVLDAIAAGDGSGGAPSPVLQALLPGGDLSSHVVALLSQVWRNAQREEHAIRAATLLWQLRADGEALLRQSGHGSTERVASSRFFPWRSNHGAPSRRRSWRCSRSVLRSSRRPSRKAAPSAARGMRCTSMSLRSRAGLRTRAAARSAPRRDVRCCAFCPPSSGFCGEAPSAESTATCAALSERASGCRGAASGGWQWSLAEPIAHYSNRI